MAEENNIRRDTVIEETHERLPRRWPLLLLYILMALAVAVLVVFGGRALYHRYHHPVIKTVPIATKNLPVRPSTSSLNNDNNSSNKNTTSNSSAGSTNNTGLPDSGPGQVIGLFVGSVLAAAGLHYLFNLQRSSKNFN